MSSKGPSASGITDRRLQTLEDVMRLHQYHRDALLEILQNAQDLYGFLDSKLLLYISQSLRLPPSHVYGVATFYNFFKLKQPGAHVVTFCMGTACYVRGVEQIINVVEKEFKVKRGETTPDRRLTLFITRCIGCCAMAPNVIIDDEVIGKANPETVLGHIRVVLEGEKIEAR